jgi:hypothetical protein
VTARLGVLVACISLALPAAAQSSLLPRFSGSTAPAFTLWSLSDPVPQADGSVTGVSQLSVPLSVRAALGRWTFDAGAAFASSRAEFEDAGGETRTLTLSGLTDVRLRARVPVAGEGVVLTAGVNVPTGATKLSADETAVLQLTGAPALRMPVPALGVGFGATLGVVAARQAGRWAIAVGASVEERTEYTPIEIALAGGTQATSIDPGLATHLTLGADRTVGAHRLSLLVVGDVYGKDALTDGGDDEASVEYTLGPSVTGLARLDVALSGWRDAAASVSVRQRSAFKDGDGAKVDGSNGLYFEASLTGVRGAPYSRGIVYGVDALWHSGIDATDAMVGAAAAIGGVTLGLDLPLSNSALRITARVQGGSMDTGTKKFTATGVTLTAALGSR